jgi:hypothetical protein
MEASLDVMDRLAIAARSDGNCMNELLPIGFRPIGPDLA